MLERDQQRSNMSAEIDATGLFGGPLWLDRTRREQVSAAFAEWPQSNIAIAMS